MYFCGGSVTVSVGLSSSFDEHPAITVKITAIVATINE
jgi:hypothetical protein